MKSEFEIRLENAQCLLKSLLARRGSFERTMAVQDDIVRLQEIIKTAYRVEHLK